MATLITALVSAISCGILAGPMTVGLYQCLLKKARGQNFEYGDVFNGVKLHFVPALLIMLAVAVPGIAINIFMRLVPTFILKAIIGLAGSLLMTAWFIVASMIA
ncbi:MAG: hypothetical protein NTV22_11595, partial [bacterium]|nr:hypothetical protein [bacterium]